MPVQDTDSKEDKIIVAKSGNRPWKVKVEDPNEEIARKKALKEEEFKKTYEVLLELRRMQPEIIAFRQGYSAIIEPARAAEKRKREIAEEKEKCKKKLIAYLEEYRKKSEEIEELEVMLSRVRECSEVIGIPIGQRLEARIEMLEEYLKELKEDVSAFNKRKEIIEGLIEKLDYTCLIKTEAEYNELRRIYSDEIVDMIKEGMSLYGSGSTMVRKFRDYKEATKDFAAKFFPLNRIRRDRDWKLGSMLRRRIEEYFSETPEVVKDTIKYSILAARRHLAKNECEYVDSSEKIYGADIGAVLDIYNERRKRFEKIMLKLAPFDNDFLFRGKEAENIDFNIFGEEVSIDQKMSVQNFGDVLKVCVTSSEFISDNCMDLREYIENGEDPLVFYKDETLISSMLDILTLAIAVNCKDVRTTNISLDLTDKNRIRAHNIDIQSGEYWRREVKNGRFPYDLDKLDEHSILDEVDFGIVKVFYKKSNLTKTVSDLFFLGETSKRWLEFDKNNNLVEIPGTVFFDGFGRRPLMFSVFSMISKTKDVDEKLKKSFEKAVQRLRERFEYLKEAEDRIGREYSEIYIDKLIAAFTRLIKLNTIIKNNCKQSLFKETTLEIMKKSLKECEKHKEEKRLVDCRSLDKSQRYLF